MRRWWFLLLLVTASCARCGDGDVDPDAAIVDSGADATSPPDTAADAGDQEIDAARDGSRNDADDTGVDPSEIVGSDEPSPLQEGVSPDGLTDLTPTTGVAGAGRFSSDETGFHGLWAHCKDGDIKLFNGVLEACISGVRSNRHELFAGGALVDLRPTGNTSPEVFDIFLPRIGFNIVHADEVRVVRDGSDGGPAVVRVTGSDMPVAYLVGVAGPQLFSRIGFSVTLEYRLDPDADFIEVATFASNPTDRTIGAQRGEFFAFGDRAREWRFASGFADSSTAYDALFGMADEYTFGWVSIGGTVTNTLGVVEAPWQIATLDQVTLEPGESWARRSRLLVAPTLDHAIVRAREELGQTSGAERTFSVQTVSGAPVAGRIVEVSTESGAVSAGVTGDDGTVVLTVPDGEHRVTVSGVIGGGGADEMRDVEDEVAMTVPTPSTLTLHAIDEVGTGVEAAVWLESFDQTHRATIPRDGLTVELLPGTWELSVGRGPEWEGHVETVVVGDDPVSVDVTMVRAFDTVDWVTGDFHQHMEPSPDSVVRVEHRILANVAMGIELITPTDHDVVTDLTPYIAELGLDDVVSTFSGVEISPTISHLNVYPMPWQYDAPGRGTVLLAQLDGEDFGRRSIPEIIAAARALPTNPIVQLNHPRDSGFFAFTGFDPEAGPDANDHSQWTTDFDALELLNGDECQVLKDWAGLWNAGLTPTAIGSSDVHADWGNIGIVRSYIHAPGVEPHEITPEVVSDAIRAHRIVAASHAFVEFTDGKLPGDTITADADTPVQFGLRVSTPSWAEVDTIQVVSNGAVIASLSVTPTTDVIDFDDVLDVSFSEDAWVSFIASGPAPGGAFRPGGERTFAFTNPIVVDVGGDGFTPPGPGPLSLDSTPYCL